MRLRTLAAVPSRPAGARMASATWRRHCRMMMTTKRCTISITRRSNASVAGAMQAQQQRHIGKGDAGHADGDDAPRPDFDIGRGLGTNAKQAERPRQRPHRTDQPARQRVGIDDREDHEPGGGEIADPGTQQHHGDTDEDEHREQLERETPQHERQPEQRLPDARQTETPLMLFGLRGYIRRRGWRIDRGQRRRPGRAPSAARRASSNATGRWMTRKISHSAAKAQPNTNASFQAISSN